MHARASLVVIALVACGVDLATAAQAQTQWLDRDARSSVRIEALAPADLVFFDTRALSGAAFATARIAVGRGTWLVEEIPYAQIQTDINILPPGGDFELVAVKEWAVGNPYAGVEFARHATGPHYELGLRLPLVNPNVFEARLLGFATGVEHEDAFVDHLVELRGAVDVHRAAHVHSIVGLDVRIGPTWDIATEHRIDPYGGRASPFEEFAYDFYSRGSVLFLDYAANLRLEGPHVRVGAGFAGRWAPLRRYGDFGLNSVHELSFVLELVRGPVHPGVYAQLPLDNGLKEFASGTVGFTLSAALARAPRRDG